MKQFKNIMVVPCYNEGKKMQSTKYEVFANNHPDTLICFVDDGSADDTLEVLSKIKGIRNNVDIISDKINVGKAEAVRKGVLTCCEKYTFDSIAFLDADLAVSLDECLDMSKYLTSDIVFCFGSRISKIGSNIDRKRSRFLIGRVIATIISNMLDLKVYDTQCGCKVFKKDIASKVFQKSFISKWLFDVEIFFRIIQEYGQEDCLKVMLEVPLVEWIDRGDSKVKNSYFFKLFVDLFRIRKQYA